MYLISALFNEAKWQLLLMADIIHFILWWLFLHTLLNFSIAKKEIKLKSSSPVIRSLSNMFWGCDSMASHKHLPFKFLTKKRVFFLRSLKETFPKDKVNIQNFILGSSWYRSRLDTVLHSFYNSHLLHILSHWLFQWEILNKQVIRQDSLLSCKKSTFMYRDETSTWNTQNTIADNNLC